jgi:hypothetical protein
VEKAIAQNDAAELVSQRQIAANKRNVGFGVNFDP